MASAGTTEEPAPATRDRHPPAPPHPEDLLRLVAIGILAIVVLVAVTTDWDSPIRVALTLAFLLVGPGLALGELLEIEDPVRLLAVAIGASLALETLVATTLFYTGLFSVDAVCGIVVGVTCVALLAAAWRRSAAPRVPATGDRSGAAT
ncbi:MAG TPA: hypothetical protein VGV67_10130 [Solirubrobacteraceae bacterium]|nr:hypothetical protein [Solirubrobacteraceae bacterium]